MNATLAAGLRLPLEVLHRVRDVDRAPVDADFRQRPVEQLARRADERQPGAVLLVTGLLAHEHDAGVGGPFPEDGAGRPLPEVTCPAGGRLPTQRADVRARG